ncbi:MAG TPA: serine/threonine-protein kinase [Phototrophicaceae bacterium]|nr:serine/threonine-protein kinase [Phototrophicaceae bacterium]
MQLDQLSNTQIGDYILQEQIGRRAAIVLYRATQQSLKRFAVVKIIDLKSVPIPTEALEEDFVTFTRSVVALEHMHLQPIYDYSIVDNQYIFIAARFMAGNLHELLRTGAMPLEQASELAAQIIEAVAFVHANGLIHSSLSPRNVYLDEVSNAYIDDLELSRVVQAARTTKELQTLIDDPFYISVEQLQLKPLDFRSEIYSVGAILYHMVTGKAPFANQDNSFNAVLARKLHNQITPPRQINPLISVDLDSAILRTLRANPAERFPDLSDLQRALTKEFGALGSRNRSLIALLRQVMDRLWRNND